MIMLKILNLTKNVIVTESLISSMPTRHSSSVAQRRHFIVRILFTFYDIRRILSVDCATYTKTSYFMCIVACLRWQRVRLIVNPAVKYDFYCQIHFVALTIKIVTFARCMVRWNKSSYNCNSTSQYINPRVTTAAMYWSTPGRASLRNGEMKLHQ